MSAGWCLHVFAGDIRVEALGLDVVAPGLLVVAGEGPLSATVLAATGESRGSWAFAQDDEWVGGCPLMTVEEGPPPGQNPYAT